MVNAARRSLAFVNRAKRPGKTAGFDPLDDDKIAKYKRARSPGQQDLAWYRDSPPSEINHSATVCAIGLPGAKLCKSALPLLAIVG